MISLKIMRNVFISPPSPLMCNWTLTLRGLADDVPSLSHFMKEALSSRAIPLFQESLIASLVRSFDQMPFLYRGIGEVLSIPSWYGIKTSSHGFPIPFEDVETTLSTVTETISYQKE